MTTTSVDLKRELADVYSAAATPALVQVPALRFLMIDGHGDPNTSPDYAAAVEALYTVAFTIRFALKRGPAAVDAPVMPLEGLWWTPDMTTFSVDDKASWDWTMMIALPPQATSDVVADARAAAQRKKSLAAIGRVRVERHAEGLAAQILHRGPYREEGPTIERLHRFIEEQGYGLVGKHHEIYLGDPRRAAPERLRTILRQPVVRS
jgi:hypothetical protein